MQLFKGRVCFGLKVSLCSKVCIRFRSSRSLCVMCRSRRRVCVVVVVVVVVCDVSCRRRCVCVHHHVTIMKPPPPTTEINHNPPSQPLIKPPSSRNSQKSDPARKQASNRPDDWHGRCFSSCDYCCRCCHCHCCDGCCFYCRYTVVAAKLYLETNCGRHSLSSPVGSAKIWPETLPGENNDLESSV